MRGIRSISVLRLERTRVGFLQGMGRVKIGFVGNANNYPFMLARALKRMGHDVRFIVTASSRLDRPESRYADISYPYPDWIHEIALEHPLDWVRPGRKKERERIIELLNDCDWVVANQLGCSLLPWVRRPALALLTGVDLFVYCDWATASKQAAQVVSRTPLRRWVRAQITRAHFLELIRRQRAGVRNAALVRFFSRGLFPVGDHILDDLGVSGSRRVFLRMTDTDLIAYIEPPANPLPRIFCGARLNWVRPIPDGWSEIDYKGTDIMVRGIGLFYRRTGRRLDLRLVRKGLHVAETLSLLETEGVADQVTWCDELDHQRYLMECRYADIVFDQVGNSISAMVTLESMALGRPVIANGRMDLLDGPWASGSPLCQAATAEEVCAQLERLVPDADVRCKVGRASRDFVEHNLSANAAAEFCLNYFGGHF